MTHTYTYRGIVWIDLESPDDNEIGSLVKRYELHPLVGEELKSSSSVAKIDFYKDYVVAVLTIPIRSKQGSSYIVTDREIDFVIGKNFLITSRSDTVEQLEYFARIFETNSILGREEKVEHAGHAFYYMVKKLYAGMIEDLENIKDSLLSAETRIYAGDEKKMVEALSNISRELIDFRQTMRIHREVWDEMVTHSPADLFGKDFGVYMRDVRDEFNKIHELNTNSRELLADLRETNDSLLNAKQNEIIKILTMIAIIFSPLTFIAALFTIPAIRVPVIESVYGWTSITIFMVLVAGVIMWLFKKKRWL